jgi:hypothetical protein
VVHQVDEGDISKHTSDLDIQKGSWAPAGLSEYWSKTQYLLRTGVQRALTNCGGAISADDRVGPDDQAMTGERAKLSAHEGSGAMP